MERRGEDWNQGGGGPGSSMLDLFGAMLKLSAALLAGSFEVSMRTLRLVQSALDHSQLPPPPGALGWPPAEHQRPAMQPEGITAVATAVPLAVPDTEGSSFNHRGAQAQDAAISQREVIMPDTNLADDMVKLVRFSIVSIERDKEGIVVQNREKLVTDNMSADAFASWVIAEEVPVSDWYKSYKKLSDEDPRKYLRVSFEVLSRWPKQDRKFEKRQIEVLEGIREAIENRP